jgi:hypothetical protein
MFHSYQGGIAEIAKKERFSKSLCIEDAQEWVNQTTVFYATTI